MRKKIKLFIEESWLLLISSIVFGALLAFTNAAWSPRIAQNEADKFNHLAQSLLEDAERFETVEESIAITTDKGKSIPVRISRGLDKNGQTAGWAFVVIGSGFADKIQMVVATDAKFETIAGFKVLSSNETPGFGDKINLTGAGSFQSQFPGAPATRLRLSKTGDAGTIDDEIVAISGATVTSQAVVDALNLYVTPIKDQLKSKGLLQ